MLIGVGAVLLLLFSTAEVALRQAEQVVLNLEAVESGNSLTKFLLRRQKQVFLTLQLGLAASLLLLGAGSYGWFLSLLQEHFELKAAVATMLAGVISFLLVWLLLLLNGLLASLLTPLKVLQLLAAPIALFFLLLYPITFLLGAVFGLFSEKENENSQNLAANALALQPFSLKVPSSEDELYGFVPSSEVDSKIFHNALEFRTVRVRECMVPRTEIDAIEVDEGLEVLREKFIETGHSKILIYQDSLDHILGYCHQFSLFENPATLEEILTPMDAVPENMLARELFVKFITEHRSIVLVLDEFGGTSGIVTLEDVMEEIIGDINDEYDEEDLLEQALPEPGTYLFSARQEIDYLNEKYQLQLPEGDYETLGGFILSVLEEIPSTGDVISVAPFEIKILSMDEHRINTVHLAKKATTPEE
ncbi:hemolysin family protein [Rufibacter roseus]|nr:hemolysin family protein [Rufibacter roseus]